MIEAKPYVPGRVEGVVRHGPAGAGRDALVVLRPDEVATFPGPCAGVIVAGGQPLQHGLIRLLDHAVPAILADEAQARNLEEGRELVLDGTQGRLLDPEEARRQPAEPRHAPSALFTPYRSRDGAAVMLRASVASRHGITRTLSYGASAIGSLRSEFLGHASAVTPPAEFYLTELGMCCEEAEPIPLVVRLPDVTPHKLPRWCKPLAQRVDLDALRGPALHFEAPLAEAVEGLVGAAARLADYHDIRLMLPHVESAAVMERWLDRFGGLAGGQVAIGAMVESVEGAGAVAELMELAHFLAVGTNDLLASVLGFDRNDPAARPDFYHPAMLRRLAAIAEAAGPRVGEVQLDGQLVRAPGVLPLLVGLGFRIFSTEPMFLPALGRRVEAIDSGEMAELARRACGAGGSGEVRRLLEEAGLLSQ